MRVCIHPGCTSLVKRGRCAYHQSIRDQQNKEKKDKYDQQRGSWLDRYGSDWPAIRARHLLAEPACSECGSTVGLTVHHIKKFDGLADPLRSDPANLATLCRVCHGRIDGWGEFNKTRH